MKRVHIKLAYGNTIGKDIPYAGIVHEGKTYLHLHNSMIEETTIVNSELNFNENQQWALETIINDLEHKIMCYKRENKYLKTLIK